MKKAWKFIKANWKHFFWGAIAVICSVILAFAGKNNWLLILPTIAIAVFTYMYWVETKKQAMIGFINILYEMSVNTHNIIKNDDYFIVITDVLKKAVNELFPENSKKLLDMIDAVGKYSSSDKDSLP